MSKIKIAILQLMVTENKKRNLNKTEELIAEACKKTIDIVVLPEMFNCPYDIKRFRDFSEGYPGKTTELLSGLAGINSIYIVGGSIPEEENGRIYNTSFVFGRNGKLIARHRKIHLFDVDLAGGLQFRESDVISPGNSITVFDTEFCKAGVAICYDMRFPELMVKMSLSGSEIIMIPAAFNMITGPAHWHNLLRTRAIDNQVFIVAASPARNIETSYICYGHSLITDPWGNIIAEAGHGEEVLFSEIDTEYVKKVRDSLPLLKHRRKDIY